MEIDERTSSIEPTGVMAMACTHRRPDATRERVHRAVEHYWRTMLSSRSWKGTVCWEKFQRIKAQFPLLQPKLYLPYRELQAIAITVNQLSKSGVRQICTLRSVGAGGG
jgi:hypothetical protein